MALRSLSIACLFGISLFACAAPGWAQSGLRLDSMPEATWSSVRPGTARAPAPSPLRLNIAPGLLFPGAGDWLGYGWGLQFGLRSEKPELGPRLDLFRVQREFGAQRISYSVFTAYRNAFSQVENPVAPGSYRLRWSYALGERGSFGLSYASSGAAEDAEAQSMPTTRLYGQYEPRNLTLYGRYGFATGWAVSAEATAYEPGNSGSNLGLRVGVRHGF